MKRGLYDAEYHRVRERASLANPEFYDPDEPPSEASREHVRRTADARIAALGHKESEAEAARRVVRQADMDALRERTNREMIRAGWARYGLAPPKPLRSLDLMLLLGWKLEHFTIMGEDRWELVKLPRGQPPESADGQGQQT